MLKSMMIRSTLTAVACAISLSAHAIADSPKQINVPAGELVPALESLARQADVSLVYQAKELAGIRTRGARGSLAPQEAVTKLLEGTKLHIRIDASTGAMLIEPPTAKNPTSLNTSGDNGGVGGGEGYDAVKGSRSQGGDQKKGVSDRFRVAQADQGRNSNSSSVNSSEVSAADSGSGKNPDSSSNALEEIIVTARQREERISDVPATVQAFTARDIKAAGIERPADFVALTSGVSQVNTGEVGELQIDIRGINTGRDVETNFAQVVDGVLQTNPYGFNQELVNIQQIEVLKGPQGAIYGRNALAGAIIVTTKKPTDKFEADATVGYGNKNTQKASLYVAGGLSDNVKAGLGAFYRKTDGFYSNSYLNCDNCVDYYKEYGVTPRMIIDLGSKGSLDFKAKYSKVYSGAINYNVSFALPGLAALTGNPDFFQNVNDHRFDYISNIVPQNQQENKQVSVKGDWQLDIGTLTAWVAYNDQTNWFFVDSAAAGFGLYARTPWCQADIAAQVGAPLPSPTFYAGANSLLPPFSPTRCDGSQFQQRDQKDASAEIRLASPTDQPLRWLGGLYYADIKRHVVVNQDADEGRGFLIQAFVPSTGPNPTDLLFDDYFHSKVSAAFGQIAYDVVPNLEVALGLRFDSEKRSVDNNVPTGADAFAQTPGFGPGPGVPYINPAYTVDPALATTGIPSRSRTFSQLQPKLSLNWKFIEEWSAFASYGYGFRSGGFNSTGDNATIEQFLGNLKYILPNGTVSTTPAIVTQGIDYDQYKKEVSKAAEIGVKANLLDHSLALNLAAYHTRVDNMQVFDFVAGPFGVLRVVSNIDEVTLQGVEGDVRWKANRYVSMFASVGLLDSKIDAYASRPYTAGNKVPFAPAYTANAGIDFTAPLNSSGLALHARIDGNSLGRTWFQAVQNNQVQTQFGFVGDYSKTSRDPYTLVNARLGISDDHWTVTAWARNLADKRYLNEAFASPEFGGSFVHVAAGRTFGLDLSYRYGE